MKQLVRAYFFLTLFGTLVIGLEHLFVPAAVRAVVVERVVGQEYVLQQLLEFARRPLLIGVHATAGVLFALLVPLQLSSRFRARYLPLHRAAGWIFVISAWTVGVSGVGVAYAYPFAGRAGVIPNAVSASFLIASTLMAVTSARQGQLERHRAWMTRVVAVGLGIALSRAYVLLLVQGFGLPAREALAQVFWLGSGSNLLLAELWLRFGRAESRQPARQRQAGNGVEYMVESAS